MTIKKSKGSSAANFFKKQRGGNLSFGSALASARRIEESSQASFAKLLGISVAHLCDLEKGRRFVSAERAAAFARTMKQPESYWVKLAIQDQISRAGLNLKVEIAAA